ncbi:hypothetical protein WJX77_007294 [Trebouxia sp. C0004]
MNFLMSFVENISPYCRTLASMDLINAVTRHVQTEWPLHQMASLQSHFEQHVYHTFLQMGDSPRAPLPGFSSR